MLVLSYISRFNRLPSDQRDGAHPRRQKTAQNLHRASRCPTMRSRARHRRSCRKYGRARRGARRRIPHPINIRPTRQPPGRTPRNRARARTSRRRKIQSNSRIIRRLIDDQRNIRRQLDRRDIHRREQIRERLIRRRGRALRQAQRRPVRLNLRIRLAFLIPVQQEAVAARRGHREIRAPAQALLLGEEVDLLSSVGGTDLLQV